MHTQALIAALLASAPLIAAHGRLDALTADAGGNTTGIGIMGGVVPLTGPNAKTEPDTTVFKGRAANQCGATQGGGTNNVNTGLKKAMALSGNTLPQMTAGGSLSGIIHVVTSDGGGPYNVLINEDGTANTWKSLTVTTQVPGNRGNIKKTQKRSFWERAVDSVKYTLTKRATNINENWPIKATVPNNIKCTGTVGGVPNTCVVKFINTSNAGPFGGCAVVQQVQAGGGAAAPAAPAAGAAGAAGAGAGAAMPAGMPGMVGRRAKALEA